MRNTGNANAAENRVEVREGRRRAQRATVAIAGGAQSGTAAMRLTRKRTQREVPQTREEENMPTIREVCAPQRRYRPRAPARRHYALPREAICLPDA